MNRLCFVLASFLTSALPIHAAPDAMTKQNVLCLFADDQRADTIAELGNPHIVTPNLHRLVKRGASLGWGAHENRDGKLAALGDSQLHRGGLWNKVAH